MERRADRDLSDIIGFDDGTFDAVMPFLTSIGQIQEEIAEATDLASIERLCAKGAVEPLVAAAIGSKDPRRCLMPLVDIGHEMVEDYRIRLGLSGLSDAEKEAAIKAAPARAAVIENEILSYMHARSRSLAGSDDDIERQIAAWLADIVKFAQAGGWQAHPDIKKDGFITRIKSHKSYSKKQDSIGRAMAQHAKTPKDVSIWLSRYVLGPAIENAKEGYTVELGGICGFSDEQLLELCCRIAGSIGISAVADDFDVADVRNSMRMLCRARTGYTEPEMFLLSRLCSV